MMDYIKDEHRVHLCIGHVVFCPKFRKPILKDKIAQRFKEIVEKLSKEKIGIF